MIMDGLEHRSTRAEKRIIFQKETTFRGGLFLDCCNEVEAVGRVRRGAAPRPRRAKGELTLASIRIELLLDALDTLMLFSQKRQGGVF